MEERPAAISPADIRRAAIELLARREHSLKELQQKLSRRFPESEIVEQQLAMLAEENLQSDRRFCEVFVRSKCQQGQGPRRISQQLKQRGIDGRLVQEFVWDAGIHWSDHLEQLYIRRYGAGQVASEKERAKRIRFLQYRGFEFDAIRELLNAGI